MRGKGYCLGRKKESQEAEEAKEVQEGALVAGLVFTNTESMALMKPARSFEDLLVWQRAHQFTIQIYALTANFPKHEIYGLSQQMRRAAVSIAANIAEGFGRRGKADKARFMNMAEGSLEESRYYLTLAKDLGYADTQALRPLVEEISRLLRVYAAAILASR